MSSEAIPTPSIGAAFADPASRTAPVRLAALVGILGTVVLMGSFFINPAPPSGLTVAQLAAFAEQHHLTIVLGAWLQGIGSLMTVIFAIALVFAAGATNRIAGWLTFLAGGTILMVSLVETAFYLAATNAVETGDVASGLVAASLIQAIQHVFLIAPAVLLPLGSVLLSSNVLPRPFAYAALVIGGVLQALGLLGLFAALQPIVDVMLIVQGLWFLAAAGAFLVRGAVWRPHA